MNFDNFNINYIATSYVNFYLSKCSKIDLYFILFCHATCLVFKQIIFTLL